MGQHKNNPMAQYYKEHPKKTAHLASGETYECLDVEARIVPFKDIFPAHLVDGVKNELKAQVDAGLCHKNAWKLAHMFKDVGMEYCEGILLPEGMPPIHHCFNRFRGKFLDVTQEVALGDRDLSDSKWTKVLVKRIFPADTIQRIYETEMRSFITFDGYDTEDGRTVYYDDEGNRQIK